MPLNECSVLQFHRPVKFCLRHAGSESVACVPGSIRCQTKEFLCPGSKVISVYASPCSLNQEVRLTKQIFG